MRAWRRPTGLKLPRLNSTCTTRDYWKASSKGRQGGDLATLLQVSSRTHDDGLDMDMTVTGYVRSIRKQKRVAFAAIGDGSNLHPVQAVLDPDQAAS